MTSLEELEKKLSSISEKVANLEAEKKANEKYISLLETKVLSGPSKEIQGVAPTATEAIVKENKKLADEQKNIDFIRKNYSVGEVALLAVKKNLIPRQGS